MVDWYQTALITDIIKVSRHYSVKKLHACNALLFITSKSNAVTTDYRRRLFAGKDRTKSQCSHVTLNFMTLTFNSIPSPLGLISCKKTSTKPVT